MMTDAKSFYRLFQNALSHPIGRRTKVQTVANIVGWQVRSRFTSHPIRHEWVNDAVLMLRRGMVGATGNVYVGLHEFPDMGFVAHLLRPDDLFVDVGANVGSYTVLAAAVCGTRAVCFEPDPDTARSLRDNLSANGIAGRVTVHEAALGASTGTVSFTRGLDAINHIALPDDTDVRTVPMTRLDDALHGLHPVLIKVDVEGHEQMVLEGGPRTLADPALLAIEVETVNAQTADILSANGFVRRFYDPFARQLRTTPPPYRSHNGLYVRNEDQIIERLISAKPIRVSGMRL